MNASDYKCVACRKVMAVAFYPVFDIDIKSYPYCRKCLDKIKLKLLIKLCEK